MNRSSQLYRLQTIDLEVGSGQRRLPRRPDPARVGERHARTRFSRLCGRALSFDFCWWQWRRRRPHEVGAARLPPVSGPGVSSASSGGVRSSIGPQAIISSMSELMIARMVRRRFASQRMPQVWYPPSKKSHVRPMYCWISSVRRALKRATTWRM